MAAARVLERAGVEVVVPRAQTCCGQPAFNSGFRKEARSVAKRFLEVFDHGPGDETGTNPIVVPSGSCGAMVRNFYPELFHDDPATQARARATGRRVFEFSEFIVDRLGVTDLGAELPNKLKVSAVYHQCCHLLRELHVDRQPKALLEQVRGLELRRLERPEVCCGFGGTFAIKLPEISTALMDEKLRNVAASGAEMLIAGDSGCLMHMDGGMRRRGMKVRALHYAEVLDMATGDNATRRVTTGDRATRGMPTGGGR
jgi:L-lactate dehydrogenase complex protein LldE